MKNEEFKKGEIVIYKAKGGPIIDVRLQQETVWLSLNQLADLFERDKSVISRHLRNIFEEEELTKDSVVAKYATTAADGKTYQVEYYNLDAMISVGYRVNSKTATRFRQWATNTLRTHIIDGYTINKARVGQNYKAFMEAVQNVRALLPASNIVSNKDILELISVFADTWFSLNAFDRGEFGTGKPTKIKVALTTEKLAEHIVVLKRELMEKGEASDMFASERNRGALEGIVGNVMQALGGKDIYPSVEEKAAHLLYFIVKNHPFIDGNKRTGAYSFVWLLRTTGILDISRITPAALTAITLLIAESNPTDKDKMVNLVTMLLTSRQKRS
jgi:prophage maintenance system killer protein